MTQAEKEVRDLLIQQNKGALFLSIEQVGTAMGRHRNFVGALLNEHGVLAKVVGKRKTYFVNDIAVMLASRQVSPIRKV